MSFEQALQYAVSLVGKAGITLKEEQTRAIRSVYDGNDVFLWLPTGFGKSVCYEVLPFLFDYKMRARYVCLTCALDYYITILFLFS